MKVNQEIAAAVRQRWAWLADYERMLDDLSRACPSSPASHLYVEQKAYDCASVFRRRERLPQDQLIPAIVHSLEILADYLARLEIEFWLDGGALLGAYRDGRMIPWDNDADIAIRDLMFSKLTARVLEQPLADREHVIVFRRGRFWELPNRYVSADIMPVWFLNRKLRYKVDVFVYHTKPGGQLVSYWPFGRPQWARFDESHLLPLQQIEFEGRSYPCPNRTREYLVEWYGDLSPRKYKGIC